MATFFTNKSDGLKQLTTSGTVDWVQLDFSNYYGGAQVQLSTLGLVNGTIVFDPTTGISYSIADDSLTIGSGGDVTSDATLISSTAATANTDALPAGTTNDTLRYNGTDWVATSNVTSTSAGVVTAAQGFTATAGGVTATAGNITATAGNIVATAGSVSAGTTVTAGTGVTATTGNITASAGAVSANTTVTAGTGVTATTGDITATAGAVSANTTVTAATGNITATAGNIVATAGSVSAGTTVTGATGLIATSGGVTSTTGGMTIAGASQSLAFTGTGSKKITGLTTADITAATDAANKEYVDNGLAGLDVKEAVELATVTYLADVNYSSLAMTSKANGPLSIDGVAAVATKRVLIKNEITSIGTAAATFVAYSGDVSTFTIAATGINGGAAVTITLDTDVSTIDQLVTEVNDAFAASSPAVNTHYYAFKVNSTKIAIGAKAGGSVPSTGFTLADGTSTPLVGDLKMAAGTYTSSPLNGIFTVTNIGSGAPFVLTRATDHDGTPTNEISTSNFTFVTAGTINSSRGYILSATNAVDPAAIAVDTETKVFTQFSASTTITVSDGTSIDVVTTGNDNVVNLNANLTSGAGGFTIADEKIPVATAANTLGVGNLSFNDATNVLTVGTQATVNGNAGATLTATTGNVTVTSTSGSVLVGGSGQVSIGSFVNDGNLIYTSAGAGTLRAESGQLMTISASVNNAVLRNSPTTDVQTTGSPITSGASPIADTNFIREKVVMRKTGTTSVVLTTGVPAAKFLVSVIGNTAAERYASEIMATSTNATTGVDSVEYSIVSGTTPAALSIVATAASGNVILTVTQTAGTIVVEAIPLV